MNRPRILNQVLVALLTIAAAMTGQNAWATITGSGTLTDPYMINSDADWETFASWINNSSTNSTYRSKYYKLGTDINVSTMVGTSSLYFAGTFDGDGHTMTVNLQNDDPNVEGVAPFHYTCAEIRNLNVTGTITSAGKYAGGLVGFAVKGTKIYDCVVTATITTSADYPGGFFGIIYGDNTPSVSFENCVFAGTIQSSNSEKHRAGAFCGSGSGYTYFTNCLESGTYTSISMLNPRCGSNNFYNSQVNSLYYMNRIGDVGNYITEDNHCFRVLKSAPAIGICLARTIHGYTYYQPVNISGLKDIYMWNNNETVSLGYTLMAGLTTLTENTDYEVSIKNSSNETVLPEDLKAVGTYTITFIAKTGNEIGCDGQSASYTFDIATGGESLDGYIFATEGNGALKAYLINNEADLERLAAYVNSNHNASGMTFKLSNDITMTAEHTPIGDYVKGYPFNGTFNGNDKTITGLTINKPEEKYQGLFGRIGEGAVVHNLTLDECNITAFQYSGAIVGYAYGGANDHAKILNCHVNGTVKATMEGGGRLGGIAGISCMNDITNCTVTGSIYSTLGADGLGGIVGYANTNAKIKSCENAAHVYGPGTQHGGITGSVAGNVMSAEDCLNTGVIEGTERVGAITGDYNTGTYTNCYYVPIGNVTAFGREGYPDVAGKGERVYLVANGDNVGNIAFTGTAPVTSLIDGKKYCKTGNWTVTLTPTIPVDHTFITYTCEGATLTNPASMDGSHTLTVSDQNVTIVAVLSDDNGIAMSTITVVDIPDQRWKGTEEIIPAVTLTDGEKTLVEGTDYLIVGFTDNNAKGEATVTLVGINDYTGTTTKNFNIVDFPLKNPDAANSADNPYLIATEADLQALACIVNSGARSNGHYLQTDPITLTKEHTPIGIVTSSAYRNFKGTYDGGNNAITGLTINKPEEAYQGMFGRIENAVIKNVVLVDCDITGANYTGGVVGYMNCYSENKNLEKCIVSGAVKVADGQSWGYHGGIVGSMDYGTIDCCVNMASVTGNGQYHGGIVGNVDMYGTNLKNSFNAGVVEGTSYVGALVGRNKGVLANNYHTASTTGGVGENGSAVGTDKTGAEIVAKISAGDGVSLTLPDATYVWNNENLYKSGTVVTLSYAKPDGKFFDHYRVNNGKISNAGTMDGDHMLTGFTENVVITGSHVDTQTDIATATIAAIDDLTFSDSEQHPVPVVKLGDETLIEDAHYTVSYDADCTNVGEKIVTITGIGRFNGTNSQVFNIIPFDVAGCTVTLDNPTYTRNEIELNPIVKYGSSTMTKGQEADYTFVTNPASVLDIGDYTLTITGHGNYKGTKEVPFQVICAVPASFACSSVTATTATLTWTDGVAANWTVEYSTDNTFATSETVQVTGQTALLTALFPNTAYYARVKAVYGENEESLWSTVCSFEPTAKLVIGSGTETTVRLPASNNTYSLTQQIYTAAELGNKAGTILSMDFYKTGTQTCKRKVDIYLVKTSKEYFTSDNDWIRVTEADKVFSGQVNFADKAWTTITLNSPFEYDGTSNLALIVDNNTGKSDYVVSFRSYSVSSNQSIYKDNDNSNLDPKEKITAIGNINKFKSQIRLLIKEADITLADNDSEAAADAKNSAIINANDGKVADVTLSGRTLYKNGEWNTICLPFNVVLANSPLAGATAKTLANASVTGTTVSLTFGDAVTTLLAGVPYIIKWDAAAENIVNPVFSNVIIDKTDRSISSDGDQVQFLGYYDAKPITAADDDIYYMTAGSALRHTGVDRTLNACRAYFRFSDNSLGAREFVLNFGDEETTAIDEMRKEKGEMRNDAWYTLEGVRIGKPTRKGLYIFNGKITVIQ